jgi:hypothetical protein
MLKTRLFLSSVALSVMVTCFHASVARAETVASGSEKAWDTPGVECGTSCLYQRANDNLGIEAVYIEGKINELDGLVDLLKQGSTTKTDAEKMIRDNLGEFCKDIPDAFKCFSRYKYLGKQRLAKIRSAIVKNNDAMVDLESKRAGTVGRDAKTASKPAMPYIPTFDEVNAEYRLTQARLQHSIKNDYSVAVRDAKPEPEDFVKFKQVTRNNGEKLMVPDESCATPPCIDQAAYKKALDAYNDKYGKAMAEDLKKLKDRTYYTPDKLTPDNQGSISVDAYKETHNAAVKVINDGIQKSVNNFVQKSQNFSTNGRGPAAASPANQNGKNQGSDELQLLRANDNTERGLTVTPDGVQQMIDSIKINDSDF